MNAKRWSLILIVTVLVLALALAGCSLANQAKTAKMKSAIPTIPTPGTTATPEPLKFQLMKTRLGVPFGFEIDPAFWQMLTPEGQAVLSRATVIISDEPRSYVCPRAWEVGSPTPTPAVCTYYGGIYDGATNTIGLWGEAAQANPDILRHEALHALDAADDMDAGQGSPFQKLAGGELAQEAEALYNAGGGTWFRPGDLYAMVPLVVEWDFDLLPSAVAAYYAEWFITAGGN
jgi:hypothetical protein